MGNNASPAPVHQLVGKIFSAATDYAEAHLQDCAKDLVTWHKTGICPDGAFRVCAGMIPDGLDQMQMAEFIVTRAALFVTAYPPNSTNQQRDAAPTVLGGA